MKKVSTLFQFEGRHHTSTGHTTVKSYVVADMFDEAITRFRADKPGFTIVSVQELGRVVIGA